MIDAFDKERFEEASLELSKLLTDEQLLNTPILVLGNKVDLPYAVSEEELIFRLRISNEIYGTRLKLVMCSIVKKFGIKQAFEWIETKIT